MEKRCLIHVEILKLLIFTKNVGRNYSFRTIHLRTNSLLIIRRTDLIIYLSITVTYTVVTFFNSPIPALLV